MNDNHPEPKDDDLRQAVIDVVLAAGDEGVKAFDRLLAGTTLELGKRTGVGVVRPSRGPDLDGEPGVSRRVLDISWDLARQGIVTLDPVASNPRWPGLRRSRFCERARRSDPPRYHDNAGFLKALRLKSGAISPDAAVYLGEAVTAFYMDCLLSSCVTLGIAAEREFLRTLGVAKNSRPYGKYFCRIGDDQDIATKISQFQGAIKPIQAHFPKAATDELEANLDSLQSVIRITRKDSSRPSGLRRPSRDQAYLQIQLFIPFARQMMRLRQELNQTPCARLVRLH